MSLSSGGQLYVYGATTGGAAPMSAFANGQTIQITNASGNVSAELAVTTSSGNNYSTSTSYDAFGGLGVSGFNYAQGFYGVNPGPGPNLQASVTFTLSAPALVVVTGMGSSQATLSLSGLANPTPDVSEVSGVYEPALAVEHEYLQAGTYTVQVTTGDGGVYYQAPQHEVDLIGVLIFSTSPNAASSSNPTIPIPAAFQPPCSAYVYGSDLPGGNWSGYIVGLPPSNDPSGAFQSNSVTDVKGTWTVPEMIDCAANPHGVFSTWIGIGGWGNPPCASDDTAFVQIGISGYYNIYTATPEYYAWYETPGLYGGVLLNPVVVFCNFPVDAGDTISAEVKYTNGKYVATIRNITQNFSSPAETLSSPDNHAKTAEWIVENSGGAPIDCTVIPNPLGYPLADFGAVNFSGCSVTLNSGGNSETGSINSICGAAAAGIVMGSSTVEAQPSGLSSDGAGFSVTYLPPGAITYTINTTDSPSNGGTNSGSVNVYSNQVVTVTATPNSCFSFQNWTENGVYLTNSPTYTFIATNNRNLTANFVTNIYTVTTSVSPSDGGTVTGAATVDCGDSVTLVASNNLGYSFAGWTWIDNGVTNWVSDSSTFTFSAVANSNLVANFDPLGSSTITTLSSPSSAGSTMGGGPYTNGVMATITATAAPCYAFLYWTTNGVPFSFLATNTIPVTTHEVFTANFAQISYYIGATDSVGGTVVGGGSYGCGNQVTLVASPNSCYSFVNWTENNNPVSTSSVFNFSADTNHNFVANFAPISSAVSTASSPANAGTSSGGGTFGCEFSVPITAAANSGWAFANWTENGVTINTSSNFTFTGSGNHSLAANFVPNVLLGFDSPPWSTNGLDLILQGPIGSNYEVDLSTDLFNWQSFTNFTSTSSPFYFSIPPATNANQGFYRALTQ